MSKVKTDRELLLETQRALDASHEDRVILHTQVVDLTALVGDLRLERDALTQTVTNIQAESRADLERADAQAARAEAETRRVIERNAELCNHMAKVERDLELMTARLDEARRAISALGGRGFE